MLSCEQVLALLGEHLDARTTAELRRQIVRHLERCGTCSVLFDAATRTLRVVSGSSSFEIPPEFSARILAAVRERFGGSGEPAD